MNVDLADGEYEVLSMVSDRKSKADIESHPDFRSCKAFGLIERSDETSGWKRTLAGSAVALRHTASKTKHDDPNVYDAARSSLKSLAGLDDTISVPRNLLVRIDSELSAVAHGRPPMESAVLSGRVRELLRQNDAS